MEETRTYTGGCHCGAVRYEVSTKLDSAMACNCSICSKKASLLTFVGADQFRLLRGQEKLTKYLFNKQQIQHLFCSVCGVESFATGAKPDGQEMRAINVRCLDDVDVSQLKINQFDGKSR